MSVRTTLSDSYSIVKSSWSKETTYLISFGLLMGIIILPFAFLVAIAAVGVEETVNNPFDMGLFFWESIFLLVLVSNLFILMSIGMMQKIGNDRRTGKVDDMETLIKHPFQKGRFGSFVLLSLLTTVIFLIAGGIFIGIDLLFNITENNVVWANIVLTFFEVITFLLLTPPLIFASRQIITDKSRRDAFMNGWREYGRRFSNATAVNIVAFLPIAAVIALITFAGLAISWVGDEETALNLAYILGLSFVIIIAGLAILFVMLPYYVITVGNSHHEETPPPTTPTGLAG